MYHESSAAILTDGIIRAAVEEERFNRVKHGAQALVENPDELPVSSIAYCLEVSGIIPFDIDAVCFSFDPVLRRNHFFADPFAKPGDWGTEEGEAYFMKGLSRVKKQVEVLLDIDLDGRFFYIPHHLAHAASAYYPSGFEEAAILVVDGIGEYSTTMIAKGFGNQMENLHSLFFPHSLGFFWEKMSQFLGFSEYDACKVMGLAGYGDPKVFSPQFKELIQTSPSGFVVNEEIIQFREPNFKGLEQLLGTRRSVREATIEQRHIHIAAQVQDATNKVLLHLAELAQQLTQSPNLCIAGGVGLNCSSNWILKEQGPFEQLYIPSAPHDAGTATGAAMYHYFHTLGNSRKSYCCKGTTLHAALAQPYTGPEFTDEAIAEAVKASGQPFRFLEHPEKLAAKMVSEGGIIGWFQGRMEFGPRALGNRSLIGDPRNPGIREILNQKVKHREDFRPFAPSVLEEKAADWFQLGKASESYKYMLFACPVWEHCKSKLPSVIHVDGTARVQLVSKEYSSKFHALITEFDRLTGVPVVLNTSFNDSEPIVCTPHDAIRTFLKTRIDALFIGHYLLTRHQP